MLGVGSAGSGDHSAGYRRHAEACGNILTDSAAAAQDGMFTRGGLPRGLRGARWGAHFLKRHRSETVMTFPPQFVQSALIALLARD